MDLLPNEGSFYAPSVPAERQEIENEELRVIRESLPVLKDLSKWFSDQATEAEKLTNIDLESNVPAEAQIKAYQLLAELLRAKKGELESLEVTFQRLRDSKR